MLCHSAGKKTIKYFAGNLNNLYFPYHHLIKCNTIYNLEKRDSRELYHMQLLLKHDKPTCQDYHEKMFDEFDFNWKLICRYPELLHMKQKFVFFSIFFMNALMHKIYGTNLNYIFQKKLYYQF